MNTDNSNDTKLTDDEFFTLHPQPDLGARFPNPYAFPYESQGNDYYNHANYFEDVGGCMSDLNEEEEEEDEDEIDEEEYKFQVKEFAIIIQEASETNTSIQLLDLQMYADNLNLFLYKKELEELFKTRREIIEKCELTDIHEAIEQATTSDQLTEIWVQVNGLDIPDNVLHELSESINDKFDEIEHNEKVQNLIVKKEQQLVDIYQAIDDANTSDELSELWEQVSELNIPKSKLDEISECVNDRFDEIEHKENMTVKKGQELAYILERIKQSTTRAQLIQLWSQAWKLNLFAHISQISELISVRTEELVNASIIHSKGDSEDLPESLPKALPLTYDGLMQWHQNDTAYVPDKTV